MWPGNCTILLSNLIFSSKMAAGSNDRSRLCYGILVVFLLCHQGFIAQALLPACGPTNGLLTPCFERINGTKLYPMSPPVSDECCLGIRRFRFPGCLCVALVEEIGRTIDERSAIAALSLPASCGRTLPTGFNCTGFAR